MITRPEDIDFDLSRRASGPAESPIPDPARALIGVLNVAGAATGDPAEIAGELLEAIGSEFGTSGCHLVTLSTMPDGSEALTPLASAGQYGSLLRDMPPIELDSPLEAARVLRARTPRFVDALHIPAVPDERSDESNRADTPEGSHGSEGGATEGRDSAGSPQRWRSMIATQSYAVLPIVLSSEPLGVLTLQWSRPVEFDRSLTRVLESLATLTALAVASATRAYGRTQDIGESESLASREHLQSAALTAFAPALEDGGTEPYTVLVGMLDVRHEDDVAFVRLEPHAQGPSMPVTTPARLLVVAPSPTQDASEAETPAEMPAAVHALCSAVVALSDSPREWLETINRSLPRSQAGAGFSAWAARFDTRTGALVESSAGIISALVTTGAGEEQHTDHSKLPLGLWAEESYEERPRLLLPDDTLEVCLDDGPDLTLRFITRAP